MQTFTDLFRGMVGKSTYLDGGTDLLLGLFSNLIVDLFVAKTIRFTNQ